MAPSTAASRSASSKTMNGALPPSSSESFLIVGAHCSASKRPTWVEPVNVSLRTMGFEVISPPMSFGAPVTMLNTPAGTPARSASTASASAENGVASAGFKTIGQPAARAGPTLRVIMAAGKFHGVMAAHTPIGSLVMTRRRSGHGDCRVSPATRLPSSANHSMNEAPNCTSPFASGKGLPCSVVMISARSSAFSRIRSCQRRSTAARSLAVFLRQAGQAALAASMARRVSAAPIRGTVPICSPVAGLLTLIVWPPSASAQAPFT